MNEDVKIGSRLRIRMPTNYINHLSAFHNEPFESSEVRLTLEDVSKLSRHQSLVDDCARLLLSANPLMDRWRETHPPLTRWQRWRRDARYFMQRFPDAWGVITGRLEAREPDDDW